MEKETKTKKITIDTLAIMMNNSFESLEKKMATKEDLKNLEERMNGKFEGVNKRIDNFAETKTSKIAFKELDHRVSFIEEKFKIKS